MPKVIFTIRPQNYETNKTGAVIYKSKLLASQKVADKEQERVSTYLLNTLEYMPEYNSLIINYERVVDKV